MMYAVEALSINTLGAGVSLAAQQLCLMFKLGI
jgi:hypothetical protein